VIMAAQHVNMRGHMHKVPRIRHQCAQRIARFQRRKEFLDDVLLMHMCISIVCTYASTFWSELQVKRFLAILSSVPSRNDQRARTMLGEEFQKNGVRGLAVQDHDALHTALDGLDAGFHLGDHTAGDRAIPDERARL